MGEERENYRTSSARALRWAVLLGLLGLAVLIPYLLVGPQMDAAAQAGLRFAASRPWLIVALVVALLLFDVILPIPSSLVGAFAGATLGVGFGAITIWTGLTLGCAGGYWIGRGLATAAATTGPGAAPTGLPGPGPYWAGPVMLAATRSIPVLAEASVVAAGISGMNFTTFMLVTAGANLAVAFAYAAAGAMLVRLDPALAAIAATIAPCAAWALWLFGQRMARSRAAGRAA